MTREQTKKAFEATLGHEPREADYQISERFLPEVGDLAEYIWDHWMGEPDSPNLQQVTRMVRDAIA